MFNNFFSENRAVYEIISKIWWSQRGHRWQHNSAHALCVVGKPRHGHPHAHVHARRSPFTHTHTHPSARALTDRNISFILLFHGNNGCAKTPRCCDVAFRPRLVLHFVMTGQNGLNSHLMGLLCTYESVSTALFCRSRRKCPDTLDQWKEHTDPMCNPWYRSI